MKIVGRVEEQRVMERVLASNKPEFVAVYGRRRVGKTYFIKNYFNDSFTFYATGIANSNKKEELSVFHTALKEYGDDSKTVPKDWFDAFMRLKHFLESKKAKRVSPFNRRVVFLDEISWFDTPKSSFKSALEYFWNSYASNMEDIVLIVCGSATSWIINNLLFDTGGFYNRITNKIHLLPLTLKECEELCDNYGINYTRKQIIESYMIFGGIPYYYSLIDPKYSLAQNVDMLLFMENGKLHNEYLHLFSSLFKNYNLHSTVIMALANNTNGLLRTELIEKYHLPDGSVLTNVLQELQECGFIRKYNNYLKNKNDSIYQIIDPFTLFSIHYIINQKLDSWLSFINTPQYYSWSGHAFEIVCLNHIKQIKSVLGISGVQTNEFAYMSKSNEKKSQIDLVINRNDGIINLCEIKFTSNPFIIDKKYEQILLSKIECFMEESHTKSAVHLTFISFNGVKHNEYSGVVQFEINGNDLFIC